MRRLQQVFIKVKISCSLVALEAVGLDGHLYRTNGKVVA